MKRAVSAASSIPVFIVFMEINILCGVPSGRLYVVFTGKLQYDRRPEERDSDTRCARRRARQIPTAGGGAGLA